MYKMQIKGCCLLLLTHFILLVQLQMCNKTQYEWPNNNPQKCCNKCKPGEFMTKRCTDGSVTTECSPCGINYYMDEHNNEMKCKMCSRCTKANMESKESCTKTRNTVCGCRSGFKCNNQVCDQCVKIPPSPPPPQPPTATTKATMTTTKTTTNTVVTTTFQADTHLHVDGLHRHLQITVFGAPRRTHQFPVSAQRRRRCRCQSRRCVEERRNGRNKSERDRMVMKEGGKTFHMSVWVEY